MRHKPGGLYTYDRSRGIFLGTVVGAREACRRSS